MRRDGILFAHLTTKEPHLVVERYARVPTARRELDDFMLLWLWLLLLLLIMMLMLRMVVVKMAAV